MSIYAGTTLIKDMYYTATHIKAVYSGTTRIYPSKGIVGGSGYSYGYITGPNYNLKVRYQEDITNGGALFINDQVFYNNLRGIQVPSAGTYYVSYTSYVVRSASSQTDTLTLWNNNGEVVGAVSVTCPAGFATSASISAEVSVGAAGILWWSWNRNNNTFWDGVYDINFHVEKIS